MIKILALISSLLIGIQCSLNAYPIDGYDYTGIDRLLYHYQLYLDSTKRKNLKSGELLMLSDIHLTYPNKMLKDFKEDADLSRSISQLMSRLEPAYSLSVLEIDSSGNVRYAGRKENVGYQPGSVGKLSIAIAIFNELDKIYKSNWEEIRGVLHTHMVRAGDWAIPNHHTVPFYDKNKDKYWSRHIIPSDEFSLYEWLDHMISKSSNAAASVLWREAILMHVQDVQYECSNFTQNEDFFNSTDNTVLRGLANDIVNCPLREMGIGHDEWRLGSFFTSGADRKINVTGGSIGTTRGLMKFLVAMENGLVVNAKSSLELKRLMYVTDRRIRYAASGSIRDDAVFFKSGSLYSFYDEPNFVKRKYAGNRYNYMNSIAIVQKLDACNKTYFVTLMSNVLRKNSVNEHYALAAQIDNLLCN